MGLIRRIISISFYIDYYFKNKLNDYLGITSRSTLYLLDLKHKKCK